MKRYDEETYTYYTVEFCRAEEVAKLGEHADIVKVNIAKNRFNVKLIENYARSHDYDTVEITKVTEDTRRFTLVK